MKLKSLTAISNGTASKFSNRNITTGAEIQITIDDYRRAHILFGPTRRMVVNLDQLDMYELEYVGDAAATIEQQPAQEPAEPAAEGTGI
jgi:hypothetical protein